VKKDYEDVCDLCEEGFCIRGYAQSHDGSFAEEPECIRFMHKMRKFPRRKAPTTDSSSRSPSVSSTLSTLSTGTGPGETFVRHEHGWREQGQGQEETRV